MILTALRVVFQNENERVRLVWTVSDFFDEAANSIVVVCHLYFRSGHSIDPCNFGICMVLRQTDDLERWQPSGLNEFVKFAFPLHFSVKIWILGVEAEVVPIGVFQ